MSSLADFASVAARQQARAHRNEATIGSSYRFYNPATAVGSSYRFYNPATAWAGAPGAMGWTAPTTIYDRQRAINVHVVALSADIAANVGPGAFKDSWTNWLTNVWTPFFAKYQTDAGKAGALFYTDALAAETETHAKEYDQFAALYPQQKTAAGTPVPAPTVPGPIPDPPPPPAEPASGSSPWISLNIPWWGYALFAGGTALVAYAIWKSIKAREEGIKATLPAILPFLGTPAASAAPSVTP